MNRDTCGNCMGLADPDVRAQVETLTVEELRCAVVLQRLAIDQLRKEKAYELEEHGHE